MRPCDFPALVDGRPVKMTLHSVAKYHGGGKHDQVVGLDHPLKRAWTLQECILARRLLIFSNYEVFWHCQEIADRPLVPSHFGCPKELIPWGVEGKLSSPWFYRPVHCLNGFPCGSSSSITIWDGRCPKTAIVSTHCKV